MHRVTAWSILTPIVGAAAGGIACLAPAVGRSPGAGPLDRVVPAGWVGPLGWAGAGLLLIAAGLSLAAFLLLRRRLRALAAEVRGAASGGKLVPLPVPADSPAGVADTSELIRSINGLVAGADRAAAEAAAKARELEIRLKVATAERQHAESILYGISDAVLVTDTFDELVLANESAAKAFDFDPDRARRSPVDQVLKDPKVVALIREARQGAGAGGRRVVEHRVHTPAGVRTYRVTLSTIPDVPVDGGGLSAEAAEPVAVASQPAGVVAVLHDVTHEKPISEMKNEFVSNVSHELRTPLASIKAYVELLIDGEADDETTKREFYEVIQNEANRLGRLIDNILNISRIESGLVKVDRRPLALAAVVKDAAGLIAPQAEQKGIRLVERLGAAASRRTLADRDMLHQAVLNVLSNAVKYTPAGGVVTVEAGYDEARRKLVVRVTDTGIGIPPQDLPHVFEKFYRAEANNRLAAGTGLGLSLVKHIVESVHQGRMFVTSELGKGSTFGFELDACE